ncbi:PucR family transcriptional regulator [Plantactinospora siamensis]|uniref:PucR family transcriptional regulator n=1 Tax=Plantactinospora siamensis TaxID=555372 RepID=UPI00406BCFA2
MFPTVREVLDLGPLRRGAPRVLAGESALGRRVRWVHVAEVPDIAALLDGGELVLTTGIGLPADEAGLRAFVDDLADVGASGLVVELGRRFADSVPRAMVAAAGRRGLPLVELRRATPFVPITEAVHALIVDAQLTELRATEEIHQRFTELSVEGAEPAEVVRQAADLAGCPVVLENPARQVLAFDPAGEDPGSLLDGWERHSRRIRPAGRTGYDPDAGWLATIVGARGQDWGRLLLRWPGADAPPSRLTILLERAASTLALGRLIRRDAEGLERQIHRNLLTALLDHARPVDEVALRARALGVVLDRRQLIGVMVRHRPDPAGEPGAEAAQARLHDLAEAVGRAIRDARLTGLASVVDEQAVGALLALRPDQADDQALAAFAAALDRVRLAGAGWPGDGPGAVPGGPARRPDQPGRPEPRRVVVAAGSTVPTLREARRSLVEARQVADAARRGRRDLPVFRLSQVGLPGLLHLLRDEPRVQTFVERELGALLAHDAEHPREHLVDTLRAYLEHGRNKSAAAAAAHLSRPAFYERLTRIGRILDADLDSVPVCLSLHVALLALDAIHDDA